MIKRIGVLTSGGDAPGMNACIRAVVLTASAYNLDVVGFHHGFNGLLVEDYQTLLPQHVQHIIQHGGTILKSARCKELHTEQGAKQAAAILHKLQLDALLVIGGDGSFRGALAIAPHYHGQVLGIPGTIDNDIDGTDFSIGFATAIDTALDAIDKIRDTADAFERIFLVELMGRHSGYITLSAGIAAGAEQIICPEFGPVKKGELASILGPIQHAQLLRGKTSYIIVVAENSYPGGTTALAEDLSAELGTECRACILGHIQRGGKPVGADRILATKLGAYAVEQLKKGAHLKMVGEINQQAALYPLVKSNDKKKQIDPYLVRWQQKIASD
ncbi:ATP-dependent 6-phosphofructokinase [Rheinheimera sp. MMS21-TC3]|uniref:ATP-dependent 6-phosphofructokinase n=1 Tax=Rheinheimera sp. MMS21-TC3 TaxID=3072790 RepID=UPI0028C476C9|nr:ATP-dependent 6-phosphofructokinase [Rheinheimera sp. MMS21-TC3]WNO61060.1 ATP-dependent 6-phosphofructokinase [Rheinheimera sp. MMS21-TC3]